MFFLILCMQIPLRLQGSSGQGSRKLTQSDMKSLNHLRGKSTTELITHGESHFTMEVCSLPRQLLINSRSGRHFAFEILFLFVFQIHKMSTYWKDRFSLNFSGKHVSPGNLGFKTFIYIAYSAIWTTENLDQVASNNGHDSSHNSAWERHELTLCEIQVW